MLALLGVATIVVVSRLRVNAVDLSGAIGPVSLQTFELFRKTVHGRGDCVLTFLD